jgi:hypothetical protein
VKNPKSPPALLALILLLGACTATGARQVVPRPAQDQAPAEDRTRIYVARTSQVRGKLRAVHVHENSREVGAVGPSHYLVWERPAGRTIMRLVFEGQGIDGAVQSLVDVPDAPGAVLFYEVEILRDDDNPLKPQDWGTPKATLLSAQEGAALIAERKPAPLE